jgi:hypothetical protein
MRIQTIKWRHVKDPQRGAISSVDLLHAGLIWRRGVFAAIMRDALENENIERCCRKTMI